MHADLGTGILDLDRETLGWLPDLIGDLLGPGGYAVSGLHLPVAGLEELPLPEGVADGRYWFYRRSA